MQAVLYGSLNSIVEVDVDLMPGFHHVQARTFLPGLTQWSSRTHAKRLGLIAGRDANRGVHIQRDHNCGLAAELRLDFLLHGSEVRVHVQKEPVDLLGGLSRGRHEGSRIAQLGNKKRKLVNAARPMLYEGTGRGEN